MKNVDYHISLTKTITKGFKKKNENELKNEKDHEEQETKMFSERKHIHICSVLIRYHLNAHSFTLSKLS